MKRQGFIINYLITFAASILVISALGYLLGDMVKDMSTLFSLGKSGLSYRVIMQIAILSFLIAIYTHILFESNFLNEQLFLHKVIVMFFISGLTTAVFIAEFGWFPITSMKGWIGFILSFLICFIVATAGMLYKYKKEEQRYNACLKEMQKEKPYE